MPSNYKISRYKESDITLANRTQKLITMFRKKNIATIHI